MSELRSTAQRKKDVLAVLARNGDAWIASASSGGKPRLIAASFWWDGHDLVFATKTGNPTAKNLQSTRAARLAIGPQNDVIMIDATLLEETPVTKAKPEVRKGFVDAAGWDPADEGSDWAFFRLRPDRIEAYRGYGELLGRFVMRESRWLS